MKLKKSPWNSRTKGQKEERKNIRKLGYQSRKFNFKTCILGREKGQGNINEITSENSLRTEGSNFSVWKGLVNIYPIN